LAAGCAEEGQEELKAARLKTGSTMNALEWELLLQTRNALAAAGHGQKKAVISQACAQLQCSPQTLYRKLDEAGFDSQRKARADKGEVMYSLAQLQLIAGLLMESTRRNEKRLLTIEDTVAILHADGKLPAIASASWVSQMLTANALHPDQLRHLEPAQSLRSLHPNHVWQIDASVCVLYYMKNGSLKSMPQDEFYKNKPQNLAKVVSDLCTRYVASDHTSGTIWTRYYTGGETAQNLIDFFLWCISKQEGLLAHGVPMMVMLDPGAANTSGLFKNLCKRLDVELQINEPGQPRAKGQVEKSQDIVERHFEGLIRFMPELDLEGLNVHGKAWQAHFNATKKHTRHGQPRYSAWMHITPEQLRIAPPMELLRDLVTTTEQTRRVSNTMTISYAVKGHGQADYDVRYVPGVMVGQQLTVVVNAYRSPAIDVQYTDAETGELRWMCVEPQGKDAFGFAATAPVIGQEYKQAPATQADQERQKIGQAAYGAANDEEAAKARKSNAQAYAGQINIMADIEATKLPEYLPRKGTALEMAKREVEQARMSVTAAAKRLKALLGERYEPRMFAWLQERFGATGVTEAQLDALAAQLGASPAEQASDPTGTEGAAPALRVIAGGAR
jgi:hypothetical protein